MDDKKRESSDGRWMLLIALGIVALGMLVPYGQYLIYPLRLFGTFIHEASHALAAVLTGGKVVGMHVNWDTSGLTTSQGGLRFFVASAGYLGSVLFGAALLAAGKYARRARGTLMGVGLATLAATLAFAGYGGAMLPMVGVAVGVGLLWAGQRNARRQGEGRRIDRRYAAGGVLALLATFVYLGLTGGLLTWAIGLVIGLGLVFLGAFGSQRFAHGALLFLGVTASLEGLSSIKYLLFMSMEPRGHSDAVTLAEMTGLPAVFWAALWGLMGLAAVAVALWWFWRKEPRKATATAA